MRDTFNDWAGTVAGASVVRNRTASDACAMTDGIVYQTRNTYVRSQAGALLPSDALQRVVGRNRAQASAFALGDGFIAAVTEPALVTSGISMHIIPLGNGNIDSRYPRAYGDMLYIADGAAMSDGVVSTVWAASGLDKNLHIGHDPDGDIDSTYVYSPPINYAPYWDDPPSSLSFVAGIGGTHDFSVYATEPDADPIAYSLVGTSYSGISIHPTTGVLTVTAAAAAALRTITIRAADPEMLYDDHVCSVSIQSVSGTLIYSESFDSRTTGVINASLYDGSTERWRRSESTPISTTPQSQMEIVAGTGSNRYFRTTLQKVSDSYGTDGGNYRTELTLLESQYRSAMTPLGSGQYVRATDLWFGFRWLCTRYDDPPSGLEYVDGYLCQWHNEDSDPGLDSSKSPPFALRLGKNGVRAYLEANADNGGADYYSPYVIAAPFVGTVYDFMFRIRWDTRALAAGSIGAVDLYINDGATPAWTWRGQTCHPYPYTNGGSPYFKWGMYMGYWRSTGWPVAMVGQTMINHYDAFRVSENGSLALVRPALPRSM